MHLADSLTIDAHKLGYGPYIMGTFLLKNIRDTSFVNIGSRALYIGSTSISACTVEGSRSSALCVSASFGHDYMEKMYADILGSNLIGAHRLYDQLVSGSKYFTVDIRDSLGMILFRPKDKSLPNDYLAKCFTRYDNASKGKLQLVTTVVEGVIYFRVSVMDPEFKDYVD